MKPTVLAKISVVAIVIETAVANKINFLYSTAIPFISKMRDIIETMHMVTKKENIEFV